ncbi:MAG: tetratricopeptide repeat protein [Gemmatimonadota bacterium]
MLRTTKRRAGALLTRSGILLLLLTLPGLATAQEKECKLSASSAASTAADALESARTETDSEKVAAEYHKAFDAVNKVVESGTKDPTPYILAAQAAVGLGEYEKATDLLNRFVELAPECKEHADNTRYNAWVVLYNAGIGLYQTGDSDGALAKFETANDIWPDARSINNAALLYREKGDTAKAMDLYREVMTLEGNLDQVRNATASLADLLNAEGRSDEAIQTYQTYVEAHPDDVVARIQYALVLSDAGQAKVAEGIFTEVLQRDDLSFEQWVQVGVGLFRNSNYKAAAEAFSKARADNPFNKEAMENLVNARIQAGQAGDAVALGDTLVQWYPYDAGNYQLLANALARTNQNARALKLMEQVDEAPISFDAIQMGAAGGDDYMVRGVVSARKSGAGKALTIPFEFLGTGGQVVASKELDLQAPADNESTTFQLMVTSAEPILGFRYGKAKGS